MKGTTLNPFNLDFFFFFLWKSNLNLTYYSLALSPTHVHTTLNNKLRVTAQRNQFTKGDSWSKSVLTGVHIHRGVVGRVDY